MFVLHPDPYLQPAYRISPFRTDDIAVNPTLPEDNYIDAYFENRFGGKHYQYTLSGREAISIALRHYQFQKDDVVTILTTSGNFYISACVTGEIEKICRWSRQIVSNTRAILVNHEFGFPYREMKYLKEIGIPIIEDCAHSFFSNGGDENIGTLGDFVIYSFPKMFPVQIGGLLVSNVADSVEESSQVNDIQLRYIKNVLSHCLKSEKEIINQRVHNFYYLSGLIESLGFSSRFQLDEGEVPGVFMFNTDKQKIDLAELKVYFYAHGIQCSVFYGEEAFFLPVHQALTKQDMDYFLEVLKSFDQ